MAGGFDSILALCWRFPIRWLDLFWLGSGWTFDPAHSALDFLVLFEDRPDGELR